VEMNLLPGTIIDPKSRRLKWMWKICKTSNFFDIEGFDHISKLGVIKNEIFY